MENASVVSNQKIIMFVVFVFAAIMSSVMIYHWRNQPQVSASNDVLLFPDAREIKSFNLTTANNAAFSLDSFKNHWTLLFFGFTHCASICPTTLAMISKTYADLEKRYPNLQVVFVTLDPERDTSEAVDHYAKSFNPAFIGVTGKLDELRKLQSQFGVYSSVDAANGNNYQIQHTASIMLVNSQGQWAGMFKFGMSAEKFERVFMTSLASSST